MQMDVEKVFHMTGGIGVTSYAKNSSLQVFSLSLSLSWSYSFNLCIDQYFFSLFFFF
jgi:hypothetical protein